MWLNGWTYKLNQTNENLSIKAGDFAMQCSGWQTGSKYEMARVKNVCLQLSYN